MTFGISCQVMLTYTPAPLNAQICGRSKPASLNA